MVDGPPLPERRTVSSLPPGLVVAVLGAGWAICAGVAGAHWLRRAELRRSLESGVRPHLDAGWSGPDARARSEVGGLGADWSGGGVRPRSGAGEPDPGGFDASVGGRGPDVSGAGRHRSSAPGHHIDSVIVALGTAMRRLAPVPADSPAGAGRSAPSAATTAGTAAGAVPARAAARRTGWTVVLGVALALVAPMLGTVPLVWAVAGPVVTARRRLARREAQVHDQLPDVVDLLALTTAAGLPVSAAMVALGGRPGGPIGHSLAEAAAHVRHGGATAGALDRLATAGPPLRPLVEALAQHDRYGTPLLPALERVGIEARARRRRRAEAEARRLPVTLLLPLVLTTFPAFVALTVVPLLAGSLGSLSLTPP
jgi:Flp pilus assembly protein TadB